MTRRATYCTLGPTDAPVDQLWLACHGYAELAADFLRGLAAAAAPDRLLVAPEALSRFYVEDRPRPHGPESRVGATWMTRVDRLTEIEDYVAYIETLGDRFLGRVRPARVVALGFSQGTATVCRWAWRTRAPVDELVVWGSPLPPELDLTDLPERWTRLRVTLVGGSRDRWFHEAALRRQEEELREHGVRTRVVTFEGGHRLDDDVLTRLAEDVDPPSPEREA